MRSLLFFILLVGVYGIRVENCPQIAYKNMKFHMCNHVQLYSKINYHDITGENVIQFMPNRLYHNHGIYTSMSKHGILYVGMDKYNNSEWIDAFKALHTTDTRLP